MGILTEQDREDLRARGLYFFADQPEPEIEAVSSDVPNVEAEAAKARAKGMILPASQLEMAAIIASAVELGNTFIRKGDRIVVMGYTGKWFPCGSARTFEDAQAIIRVKEAEDGTYNPRDSWEPDHGNPTPTWFRAYNRDGSVATPPRTRVRRAA